MYALYNALSRHLLPEKIYIKLVNVSLAPTSYSFRRFISLADDYARAGIHIGEGHGGCFFQKKGYRRVQARIA